MQSIGADGGGEVVVAPAAQVVRRQGGRARLERIRASPRYRWWVLWTVLAGLFAINVTFTLLVVALPRLAREFGTSDNTLTWVFTGPLLAFGVAAPTLGKAGDLWGHKRLYLIGVAGAGLAAGLSALAWDAGSLIAFRTFGAIEGAATGAASMALIFRVFEPGDRVKAMGWWSLVGAGGPVLGVAIGGPVIEAVSWRWVFAAQVPLCALALALAIVVLPETERGQKAKLDLAGGLTLALSVTSLLFALNRGPEWGWSSTAVVGCFVLSPVALVAFLAIERRAPEPLLPLRYLRRRNFAFPIGALVFAQFAYMGGFILAPSLLDRVFGFSESRIGLAVIARPLAFSLSSPLAGYLGARVGGRVAAVGGTLAVAASMLLLAALDPGDSTVQIALALAMSGLGLGLSTPSISAAVANSVDDGDLGIASASQQLMNQVGLVAGIQVMSTVQTSREPAAGLLGSFGDAYLLGGAVCLLGVLCAWFVRSGAKPGAAIEGQAGTAPEDRPGPEGVEQHEARRPELSPGPGRRPPRRAGARRDGARRTGSGAR